MQRYSVFIRWWWRVWTSRHKFDMELRPRRIDGARATPKNASHVPRSTRCHAYCHWQKGKFGECARQCGNRAGSVAQLHASKLAVPAGSSLAAAAALNHRLQIYSKLGFALSRGTFVRGSRSKWCRDWWRE